MTLFVRIAFLGSLGFRKYAGQFKVVRVLGVIRIQGLWLQGLR